MDLALELGTTADHLARSMTEAEFRRWQIYAQRKMLPHRRLELYLAQLAQLVAAGLGGQSRTLQDFLFDPPADDTVAEDDDAAAFFGFAPRNVADRREGDT